MVIQCPTPRGVDKAADPDLPIEAMTAALCATDVWIEFNHQWLLYSTPFERASEVNRKLRYMCLVDFNEELLIRTVGHVDTPKLQVFMRKVAERTRNARTMHVTTPAGTESPLKSTRSTMWPATAATPSFRRPICSPARSMWCPSSAALREPLCLTAA